jgi:membrane fusion protein (multidrug efflux system)
MAEPQDKDAKPPTNGGGPEENSKPSIWKRRPVVIAGTIVLAGLLFFGLHYFMNILTHESTDNAFLDGDIVSIAPKVSGQVKKVYIADNEAVTNGQLLAEIDPRDYEILLAQKKSALAAAKANEDLIKASYELLGIQVNSARETAKQSEAAANADKAKADRSTADLKRAEDLIQRKIISPQEYDAAKSAAESAEATWRSSQAKTAADQSKVAEAQAQLEAGKKAFERAIAQADQSRVDVQQAELNLSYTRIVAPEAGRITRKAVEDGDYIQTGQKLMALVLDNLWVTANFKETQLKKIRVGQPVEVEVDSVAGKTFRAKVQSIQSGSGAAFSLLPPENAVGNYVKVVQRVPVKIVFAENESLNADHVLGPGMSAVPIIHVNSYDIPTAIVLVVALVLAVGVGIFWWKAANRTTRKP